ncbi:MAG: hypothetical protein H6753_00805 [Candidatus Omnitrophica bacterium]|nr:hypothetical protein [Candidatus Omnitrophota bacterium]
MARLEIFSLAPDICAQVINMVILSSTLPRSKVTIYKVSKQLKGIAPDLENAIGEWIDSDEFGYVRSFCNLSKHRSLVDRDYFFQINYEGGFYKKGIRFYPFEYENKSHSEKMMDELFTIKDKFLSIYYAAIEKMEKLI